MDATDETFLRRAIRLAASSREGGNPPFGSLLVGPDGDVLVEEHNTSISDNDITAHPELKLARWAAANLAPDVAAQTTMYTSCQPCPMCAGAIERSFLGRVAFALSSEQFVPFMATAVPTPPLQDGPALFDEASDVVSGYYA